MRFVNKHLRKIRSHRVAVLFMRFLYEAMAISIIFGVAVLFMRFDASARIVTGRETGLPFSLWDSVHWISSSYQTNGVAVLFMRFLSMAAVLLIGSLLNVAVLFMRFKNQSRRNWTDKKLPFSLWDSRKFVDPWLDSFTLPFSLWDSDVQITSLTLYKLSPDRFSERLLVACSFER